MRSLSAYFFVVLSCLSSCVCANGQVLPSPLLNVRPVTRAKLPAQAAKATFYDAAVAFPTANNNGGLWRFGWPAPGVQPNATTFQAFTRRFGDQTGMTGWMKAAADVPVVQLNQGPVTLQGKETALQAAVLNAPGIDLSEAIVVRGGKAEIGFDKSTGRIVFIHDLSSGKQGSVAASPADGDLWTLKTRSGKVWASHTYPMQATLTAPNDLTLAYTVEGGTVSIRAVGSDNALDLIVKVNGVSDDVLEIACPADIQFDPSELQRVIFPKSLGLNLKPSYFRKRDEPTSWRYQSIGPEPLRKIAGIECKVVAGDGAPVPLTVTEEGRKMLGDSLARQWSEQKCPVSRPSLQKPDVTLLDSPNGAFLAAHRVSAGWLIRFSDLPQQKVALIRTTARRLLTNFASNPARPLRRKRLVLLALENGPLGLAGLVSAEEWHKEMSAASDAGDGKVEVALVRTFAQLSTYMRDGATLAILNPYGEGFPIGEAGWEPVADAIHDFLAQGGVWIEVTGYAFYQALVASHYYTMTDQYPGRAFADFSRIESANGALTFCGIQDAHVSDHIFVPAVWTAGAEANGGHLYRAWQTFVPRSGSWEAPPIRLKTGQTTVEAARSYAHEIGLDRKLSEKLPPEMLKRYKRSIVINVAQPNGAGASVLKALDALPSPAIIFLDFYMHGGYLHDGPDFLPPNDQWSNLREIVEKAHSRGMFTIAWINSMLWWDKTPTETHRRTGDAPLLVDLQGAHVRYDDQVIFVSPWHPEVIAASDRLVKSLQRDYGIDFVFHDSLGALPMMYDMNPAEPTPYGFTQGLINIARKLTTVLPAASEDGFDQLGNIEMQFDIGGTMAYIVPTAHGREQWPGALVQKRYAGDTWEVFPLAGYIANEMGAFGYSAGSWNNDDPAWSRTTMLWSLVFGIQMAANPQLDGSKASEGPRQVMEYVHRLQQVICWRYMGVPLDDFKYLAGSGSKGVMESRWGDLDIIVNMTDKPYPTGQVVIAPMGFYARAGSTEAGFLSAYKGQKAVQGEISLLPEGNDSGNQNR